MNRKFWRDASERAMAGGAAVLSLVKSMLATRVGDSSSASFLSQV